MIGQEKGKMGNGWRNWNSMTKSVLEVDDEIILKCKNTKMQTCRICYIIITYTLGTLDVRIFPQKSRLGNILRSHISPCHLPLLGYSESQGEDSNKTENRRPRYTKRQGMKSLDWVSTSLSYWPCQSLTGSRHLGTVTGLIYFRLVIGRRGFVLCTAVASCSYMYKLYMLLIN